MALSKLNMETLRLSGPPHNCNLLRPRAGPDTVADAAPGFVVVGRRGCAFGRGGRCSRVVLTTPIASCPVEARSQHGSDWCHDCERASSGADCTRVVSLPTGIGDCDCIAAAPSSPADISRRDSAVGCWCSKLAEFCDSGAAEGRLQNEVPYPPLPPICETFVGELSGGAQPLPPSPLPLPPLPPLPSPFCF